MLLKWSLRSRVSKAFLWIWCEQNIVVIDEKTSCHSNLATNRIVALVRWALQAAALNMNGRVYAQKKVSILYNGPAHFPLRTLIYSIGPAWFLGLIQVCPSVYPFFAGLTPMPYVYVSLVCIPEAPPSRPRLHLCFTHFIPYSSFLLPLSLARKSGLFPTLLSE